MSTGSQFQQFIVVGFRDGVMIKGNSQQELF